MISKKTKHQKRLQEIHSKKIRREVRFQRERFSLWDFMMHYQLELFLGAILIALIIFIPRWDSLMSKQEDKFSEPSISQELKGQLLNKYPNGFKLIEIKNLRLTPLDDTLSSEFKIDWAGTQLVRFDAGKVRIQLPSAYHDLTGGVLKRPVVEFQRRHHELIRVNQLTSFDLLAEIIEDDGNKVVCLFSFEVTK
ncbi:MAG TPA: hypothetical protein VJA17_03675 [Candidatus Omnitrophota bacterium]|nr:hypothetical protein [Candidatus Omnitrophota bacterium]